MCFAAKCCLLICWLLVCSRQLNTRRLFSSSLSFANQHTELGVDDNVKGVQVSIFLHEFLSFWKMQQAQTVSSAANMLFAKVAAFKNAETFLINGTYK